MMFALRISVLPNPYPLLASQRDGFAFIVSAKLLNREACPGDLNTVAELHVISSHGRTWS